MQIIKSPTKITLQKYGITLDEFWDILRRQNWKCPICGKIPNSGRFHIEHEHVPKWKNMPPEERKKYLRGATCFYCNRFYLSKNMTIEKASNIQSYLLAYEQRKVRY